MVVPISPTAVHPSLNRTCNSNNADCLKFYEQCVLWTLFGTHIASLRSLLVAYN